MCFRQRLLSGTRLSVSPYLNEWLLSANSTDLLRMADGGEYVETSDPEEGGDPSLRAQIAGIKRTLPSIDRRPTKRRKVREPCLPV